MSETATMTPQDYIQQIKEELFGLEARLEQAEHEADSLQRTIDESARGLDAEVIGYHERR